MKAKNIINTIIGLLALTGLVLVFIYVIYPFYEQPGLQVTKDDPKELVSFVKDSVANNGEIEKTDNFSFVVLADSNAGANSIGQTQKFTGIIKELSQKEPKPSFVIHAGDMIAGYYSTPSNQAAKMWSSFSKSIQPLTANNISFFPSAGNHDASFNKSLSQAYKNYWSENNLSQEIEISGDYFSYYSFDHLNSHFIILYAPKTYIDEKQLKWLEEDLEKAQGQENIFIVSHLPLTAVSTYHPNDQLTPAVKLKELLAGKISAFFGAHHNLYYDFEKDGIRQIGVGRAGSGGKYYFKSQYGSGTQDYNSYVRVNVESDNFTVEQIKYDGVDTK